MFELLSSTFEGFQYSVYPGYQWNKYSDDCRSMYFDSKYERKSVFHGARLMATNSGSIKGISNTVSTPVLPQNSRRGTVTLMNNTPNSVIWFSRGSGALQNSGVFLTYAGAWTFGLETDDKETESIEAISNVNGAQLLITEISIPDKAIPEDYHGGLSVRLALEGKK